MDGNHWQLSAVDLAAAALLIPSPGPCSSCFQQGLTKACVSTEQMPGIQKCKNDTLIGFPTGQKVTVMMVKDRLPVTAVVAAGSYWMIEWRTNGTCHFLGLDMQYAFMRRLKHAQAWLPEQGHPTQG